MTPSPASTPTPTATGAVATDEVPTAEPVETGPVGSVEPSASPDVTGGSAAACTGNLDNRLFYARTAAAVDWTVLCAVLPKGWYVSSGQYRLANGGRLVIGYKGPAAATLHLSEGAFCADASGCVPAGTDAGEAALGDGGFAIVVDRGRNPSWLLETHGLDEATARSIAAAMAEVAARS
jgi:hypothetical protein